MNYKKLTASIYLKNGKLVKSETDLSVLSDTPIEYVQRLEDNECDSVIINDLSLNDEEHEINLNTIKQIVDKTALPIYSGGHVKRMEDIKKILYTGCEKGIVPLNHAEFSEILKEVSLKFGKDKIAVSTEDVSLCEENRNLIAMYSSELIVTLMENQCVEIISSLPCVYALPADTSLDRMMKLLEKENVIGITGNIINQNLKEISAIKTIAIDRGIAIKQNVPTTSFAEFKLNEQGLIPVIVQDYITNEVLMLAYMNEESYYMTCKTRKMTYFSRSRNELWIKGLTSGHFQFVKSLFMDCDNDTLIAKVKQIGAACHTGSYSCFFKEIIPFEDAQSDNPLKVFEDVMNIIKDRQINPKEGSYTNYLFDKGIDKILKKLGEEATEIVIAAKNPNPEEIKYEISDFLYHMMVLMAEKNVTWDEITTELAKR